MGSAEVLQNNKSDSNSTASDVISRDDPSKALFDYQSLLSNSGVYYAVIVVLITLIISAGTNSAQSEYHTYKFGKEKNMAA